MKTTNELSAQEILEIMSKNPHDAAFKLFMRHKEISLPYLRSKLSPALAKRLRWYDTELQPTEFLDKHFTEQRADLLFDVPYGKNKTCQLYLLFEGQRSHGRTMPFRLLKYMVEIWSETERKRTIQNKTEEKEDISPQNRTKIYPLPAIFPVVLYNGKERWTTPTSLWKSGLIETPAGMKPHFPEFTHALSDPRRMKEEDFDQYKNFLHTYHILKISAHSHAEEILPTLESMLEYLRDIFRNYPELARIIMTLAFHIEHNSNARQRKIATFIEEQINTGEEMTTLLHDILEEGIQKGIQKGRKEGKQSGIRQNAQKMLQRGYPIEEIAEITGLSPEEIASLKDEGES